MNKKLFGILATISSAIMFGFLPLLVKTIYESGTNTLSVVVLRFAMSIPMLYLFLKIKRIPMEINFKEFKAIVLICIFGFGGTGVLLFSSYNYISSGMATTIHFMYPMLTMVVLSVILKERFSVGKIIAQALCVLGIVLFYTGGGEVNLTGIILALLSSITYTFYTVYLGHSCLKNMNDYKLLFYMTVVGTVFVYIVALCTNQVDFTITTKGWIFLLIFAFSATFVGSLGYQFGVRYIGGQATSILSTFEPVTSVIVGILVYNEEVSVRTVIACLSIIGATVITSLITGKEETKEEKS